MSNTRFLCNWGLSWSFVSALVVSDLLCSLESTSFAIEAEASFFVTWVVLSDFSVLIVTFLSYVDVAIIYQLFC